MIDLERKKGGRGIRKEGRKIIQFSSIFSRAFILYRVLLVPGKTNLCPQGGQFFVGTHCRGI